MQGSGDENEAREAHPISDTSGGKGRRCFYFSVIIFIFISAFQAVSVWMNTVVAIYT